MDKKVLVTATNFSVYCMSAKKLLEENGFKVIENMYGRPMTFEELQQYLPEISAVLAGVDTWNEDVYKLAPNLKAIARFGVGVDNIDLAAAKKYGIKVTNARAANSDSVAETAILLMLAVYKNIINLDRSTRNGEWERYVGRNIRGKKVGLIGFGVIAQYLSGLLKGFEAKVVAFDAYPNLEAFEKYGVAQESIDEILKTCDIISLHIPGTPETKNLIDEKAFNMMKPEAILINTARGSVVDENALVCALETGRIAGAGIDVYASEPTTKDNPLFGLKNVVVAPHTAAETFETYNAVSLCTSKAVIDVLDGKNPMNWLNP